MPYSTHYATPVSHGISQPIDMTEFYQRPLAFAILNSYVCGYRLVGFINRKSLTISNLGAACVGLIWHLAWLRESCVFFSFLFCVSLNISLHTIYDGVKKQHSRLRSTQGRWLKYTWSYTIAWWFRRSTFHWSRCYMNRILPFTYDGVFKVTIQRL